MTCIYDVRVDLTTKLSYLTATASVPPTTTIMELNVAGGPGREGTFNITCNASLYLYIRITQKNVRACD